MGQHRKIAECWTIVIKPSVSPMMYVSLNNISGAIRGALNFYFFGFVRTTASVCV